MDPNLLERLQELSHDIEVDHKTLKTESVFHSPEGKTYQPNNWVNRVYKPYMEKV